MVTLVVRDYDEAIDFYVRAVGFRVVEDTVLDERKRWVVLAPPGASETGLLLARAATEAQRERIGDQTGRTRRPVPGDRRLRPRLRPDAEGRDPVR